MQAAVRDGGDVVVMAAAVADFRPKAPAATKLKKADGPPEIVLEPTPDILAGLGAAKRPGQVLVGFAAETDDLVANASRKLAAKRLDLIVANDVGAPGVGFQHDTNAVTLLAADGVVRSVALTDKQIHRPRRARRGRGPAPRHHARRAPTTRSHPSARQRGANPVTRWTFTSESVTEGHPDKMADQVSDSVLDAILAEDPDGRVACETLLTTGLCVVAGEITTKAYVDIPKLARDVIKSIGYDNALYGFDGNTCGVIVSIDEQSPNIGQGVDTSEETRVGKSGEDLLNAQGAGDQGMMFGYACDETDDLMPLPIWTAHRLAERLTEVRKADSIPYLRPDGKTQVTYDYEDGKPVKLRAVLISTQHAPGIDRDTMIRPDLIEQVIRPTVPAQFADDDYEIYVNPTGTFELGGPHADTGLTGSQDHRRHVRRHGSPRWRRLLGQGPVEGRPLRRLRGALGRQARRRRRRSVSLRGPGGVRHRHGPPGLDPGRDVRHEHRRRGQDRPGRARRLRSAPGGDRARPRPEAADLPQDRGLRALRSSLAGVHLGVDLPPRGLQGCARPLSPPTARARRRCAPPRWCPTCRASTSASTTWSPTTSGTRYAWGPGCASTSPAAGSAVGSSATARRRPDWPVSG